MPPKLSQAMLDKALGLVQAKTAEMSKADPGIAPPETSSTTASTVHHTETTENGKKKKKTKKEKPSSNGDDAKGEEPIYSWDSISHLMQDFDIDLEEAKLVLTACCGPEPENWTPPGSAGKPAKKRKTAMALVPDAAPRTKKTKSKEPTAGVAIPEAAPKPDSVPMDPPPAPAAPKKRLRKKSKEVHVTNSLNCIVCIYLCCTWFYNMAKLEVPAVPPEHEPKGDLCKMGSTSSLGHLV